MEQYLFEKHTKLYNNKYNTSIIYSGSIAVILCDDNTYYINMHLIVKNNNKIIFDSTKDFNINSNFPTIRFNQYEFFNIYNDIQNYRNNFL